jgi:hypothetical protein
MIPCTAHADLQPEHGGAPHHHHDPNAGDLADDEPGSPVLMLRDGVKRFGSTRPPLERWR